MSKLMTETLPKKPSCWTGDTVMNGELILTPFDGTRLRLSPPTSTVIVCPGTKGTATVESWPLLPVPMKDGLKGGGPPCTEMSGREVVESALTVVVPPSAVRKAVVPP